MSSFLSILIIGISLSMDAFSLALVYGIIGINLKEKLSLSLIVGAYHFIMPLIGLTFGNFLSNFIDLNLVASIILIYLGIDLIISNFKEEDKLIVSLAGFLMFGLSVSIDSLMIGVGLKVITNNSFLASITFSITSLLFTYLGLSLGNIIGTKLGDYSKIIGGIVLIILAITLFISKYII